jgi:hypothetical protein
MLPFPTPAGPARLEKRIVIVIDMNLLRLLSSAIEFLSMYPRRLSGLASSPSESQTNGIAPMTKLTSRSRASSPSLRSRGAVFPLPHVENLRSSRLIRDAPTMSLKMESL